MFESIGHTFELTYMNCLTMLAGTADRQHQVIPDPRSWEAEFAKLRAVKEKDSTMDPRSTLYRSEPEKFSRGRLASRRSSISPSGLMAN